MLDEQSFDTRRHIGSYSLDLLPGNWFIPYIAYDRDSDSGTGVTTFVQNSNEYAVPTTMNDRTNLYRGGIRFELRRFHATLEEGGTTFNSGQSLYQTAGATNPGNSNTPVFGQTLDLTSLVANYGITGSSTYTKALVTSNAFSWMDLYGAFLYSQPNSSVHYQEAATGNLYLPSEIVFYQSEQYLVSSAAKMPHTTGSAGTEIRPFKRVRITESWLTDRLHDAGNALSTQTIIPVAGAQTDRCAAGVVAGEQLQSDGNKRVSRRDSSSDPSRRLSLRMGRRGRRGSSTGGELTGVEQAMLRRNVGLGGVMFRPSQKLSLTAEGEAAASSGVYFNTSLYDYQKVRDAGALSGDQFAERGARFHVIAQLQSGAWGQLLLPLAAGIGVDLLVAPRREGLQPSGIL